MSSPSQSTAAPSSPSSPFKRKRRAQPSSRPANMDVHAAPQPAATTLVLSDGQLIDLLAPSPFQPTEKGVKFPPAQLAVLDAAFRANGRVLPPTLRAPLAAYLNVPRRRIATWAEGKKRPRQRDKKNADRSDGAAVVVKDEDEQDEAEVERALPVEDEDAARPGPKEEDEDDVVVTRAPKRIRLKVETHQEEGLIDLRKLEPLHVPPLDHASMASSYPTPAAYTPSLPPVPLPLPLPLPTRPPRHVHFELPSPRSPSLQLNTFVSTPTPSSPRIAHRARPSTEALSPPRPMLITQPTPTATHTPAFLASLPLPLNPSSTQPPSIYLEHSDCYPHPLPASAPESTLSSLEFVHLSLDAVSPWVLDDHAKEGIALFEESSWVLEVDDDDGGGGEFAEGMGTDEGKRKERETEGEGEGGLGLVMGLSEEQWKELAEGWFE